MILMKQLENKKRNDDREKKREELRVEKEKERDKRIELKKLEMEILNEARKPIEDMALDFDQTESASKELPKFERIPNMCLSGEAFANCMMIYEFLNNFGETLGFGKFFISKKYLLRSSINCSIHISLFFISSYYFIIKDMDSLPTLESLQSALCYDEESEEEILSVIIHLVVCAIEDPGIPNPQKHLTLLGQNLRQADITNTNVSEILRIYLFARAQAEVRMLHGLAPPEMHLKDRSKEALQDPEHLQRVEKYNNLLFETRPHQMSE